MILALLCFVLGLALAAITPAAYKFWSYHRAVAHLPGPPLKGLLEWVLGFPLHAMKDKSTFHTEYARILAERGPIVAARIFHKRVSGAATSHRPTAARRTCTAGFTAADSSQQP
jgi:hypothetical protein